MEAVGGCMNGVMILRGRAGVGRRNVGGVGK